MLAAAVLRGPCSSVVAISGVNASIGARSESRGSVVRYSPCTSHKTQCQHRQLPVLTYGQDYSNKKAQVRPLRRVPTSSLRRSALLGTTVARSNASGSYCELSGRLSRKSRGLSLPWGLRETDRKVRCEVRTNAAGGETPRAVATLQEEAMPAMDGLSTFEMMDGESLRDFLDTKLPSHPKLVRGQLNNGLRYVILPNAVPPNRLEAHLEMHVGSVDEQDFEQGVAHLVEHVTFLGSKKRERLMGTGARSNAYTDFHHTVFHVHSPVNAQETGEPLLPMVLEALHEIAFKPKFLSSRIEKERRAVLSELQMMNTIEYRVDCQLLQQLHSENLLSCRFPIGLEEQIHKWDADTIRAFHERWYFPANATLFIVGDIGSVGRTVEMIEAQFGSTPAGLYYPPSTPHSSSAAPATAHLHNSPLNSNPQPLDFLQKNPLAPLPQPVRKERHAIRPPVEHQWSTAHSPYARSGYPAPRGTVKVPHVFQHELLQQFSLSLFSKIPSRPVQTFADLRHVLMQRIVLSSLQFRINTRYKSAAPPFQSIDLDHSDSGREGCAVSTLTIVSEPKDWEGAVQVGVQECRRLREFGVTKGELTRYLSALLKDSEQLAAMIDNIPSVDNLEFIMESDALGHTVMDQQQGHECLSAVASTVTLEDVNATAAAMLEYIAEYGRPTAPVPAAIVACVPQRVHTIEGKEEDFEITPQEIMEVIVQGLSEPMKAEAEVDVPKSLVPPPLLEDKRQKQPPQFVPVSKSEGMQNGPLVVRDEATGVVQRKLSNGIKVNYKVTKNEARGAVMRVVAAGGRARETADASGAVAIGTRTLSEAGAVGGYSREQVELFCVSNLINFVLEADEEFMCMDFHFTMRDGGMPATFQLLHMVMTQPVWLEDALDRAKQLYLSYFRSMPKSLERATAHRMMKAMFGGDPRFMEPSPDAISRLTLEMAREAIFNQLRTGNMEVSVVGDFSEEELERCVLDYLGTLEPQAALEVQEQPIAIVPCPDPEKRHQRVMLRDTDERACAYISGAAPNRWGMTSDGRDLNVALEPAPPSLTEQQAQSMASLGVEIVRDSQGKPSWWKKNRHPLYASVALALLAEIINARLFTTVRDALGLTYDVSFELSLFDRLRTGWFVISVTSTPAKIEQAVEASLNVLRGLNGSTITQRELDRAKRTLTTRHESDLKDNTYWLSLLTHLQASSVPRKDVGCIRDLPLLYEACTADDVYAAYNFLSLDDESIFTCIGVAGAQSDKAGNGVAAADVIDVEDQSDDLQAAMLQAPGRGKSTMTRPTI